MGVVTPYARAGDDRRDSLPKCDYDDRSASRLSWLGELGWSLSRCLESLVHMYDK